MMRARHVPYHPTQDNHTINGISFHYHALSESDPEAKKFYGPTELPPELRLMLAVLADAVECLRHPEQRKLWKKTRDWVLTYHGGSLYSFASVCAHLNLHPEYIRKGLVAKFHLNDETQAEESTDAKRPIFRSQRGSLTESTQYKPLHRRYASVYSPRYAK